jgi:hypothetical protein
MSNSIFITQDEDTNNITGKPTYTDIYDTIPKNKITIPINDWRKKYYTEWRWRFLRIGEKQLAEISYMNYNSNKRVYYNTTGKRVYRDIPNTFDKYVIQKFYSYE